MAVIRPTILNINKPIGWTSRDVLNKLQSIYKFKKFGHAGTLDPLATGVLIVLVSDATKKQEYFMLQKKIYKTRIYFGVSSPTNDLEGPFEISSQHTTDNTQLTVKKYLDEHLGTHKQQVPFYSSVKVNGKELYKSAREGKIIENLPIKEVELKEYTIFNFREPKNVAPLDICAMQLDKLDLRSETIEKDYKNFVKIFDTHFTSIDLEITTSKGYYVRSLARDLGKITGLGAIMGTLERSQIGEYKLKDAKNMEYFNNNPDLV